MPHLCDPIEMEGLRSKANTVALISQSIGVDYSLEDEFVLAELYGSLRIDAETALKRSHLIAMIGEHFIGSHMVEDPVYSDALVGEAAAVVGAYAGLTAVYIDEPVHLDSQTKTHIVPAVTFEVHEVDLENVPSGSAALYPMVAVPLLGQVTVGYVSNLKLTA